MTAAETLEHRFLEFHAANPHVYDRLVALARQAKRRGREKLGIAMIYEVVRWEHFMRTDDPEGYRLNNNWRAFYARLIMRREPDLAGIFDTRAQRFERAVADFERALAEGRLFA